MTLRRKLGPQRVNIGITKLNLMARITKYVMNSTAPPAELVAPSKFFGYNQCSSRVDKHFSHHK